MNPSISIPLDLARLEKVRVSADKIEARCPACAEEGADRTGNHLAILPNGRFACAARSGDSEHRRRIFALVGIKSDSSRRDPEMSRQLALDEESRRKRARKRDETKEAAQRHRTALVERWRWDRADLWEDSPIRPTQELDDPRLFVTALFPPDALVWTGKVFQSGERHCGRWRTSEEWYAATFEEVGPMTTPAIWTPGTFTRASHAVAKSPYLVLDFDGPAGWRPRTDAELRQHIDDSLSLVRWIREGLRWRLAAIVSTGGKSVHAWFVNPGQEVADTLRDSAEPFGIDTGLIGHPEHPCRLPGQRHEKTGGTSRVLWLADMRNETSPNP